MKFEAEPIGQTTSDGDDSTVVLYPEYRRGLLGLDGFSHAIITWWADNLTDVEPHDPLEIQRVLYTGGPDRTGVFSTRTPRRPNPICLTVAMITSVDIDSGVVRFGWLDTLHETPVLDIKPYFPASDRVQVVGLPGWFASWPQSLEESATFDWGSAFVENS